MQHSTKGSALTLIAFTEYTEFTEFTELQGNSQSFKRIHRTQRYFADPVAPEFTLITSLIG